MPCHMPGLSAGFRKVWRPIAGPGAQLLVGVEVPPFCKLGSRLLPNSLSAVTHASAASKGMGGSFLVMVIKTVRTLVPGSRNVSASRSSQLSANGRS